MCLRSIVQFTWRIILLLYSSFLISVSFVFGPMQSLFYFLGYRPELSIYLKYEIHYALLILFISALCWVIFIANVILFIACYTSKTILLEIYVYMLIGKMIVSGLCGFKYLIHCWLIDTYCLDHSPHREDEDVATGVVIFIAALFYIVVGLFTIFAVLSFKLTFKRTQDDVDELE